MKRILKRSLKWLAIVLLILLVLVLCAVLLGYFMIGTERGFKFAVGEVAQRVEGLEIGEVDGTLTNGISADKINFKNEQMQISATGIDSQWRSGCLLDKTVCVDKVIVDDLSIETFASDDNTPASTADIALPDITLPVGFAVKDILIKRLSFKPPGDVPAQTLENISLAAHSEDNTLHIDTLSTSYQNLSLNTSGSITTEGDYPIDMDVTLVATDFFEQYDASTTITLTNTLDELDIDMDINGDVAARIAGRVQPLKKSLPADLSIQSLQAGWPLDTMQQVQANDIKVLIKGDMDDYQIDVNTDIKGEQIPESALELSGYANKTRALITDLTIDTLDGFVTGDAAVSWTDGITWVSELIAKDINPAVKFDGVDGKLNGVIIASGDVVDGKWTLDLSRAQVDGVLRDLPFELETKLLKNADDSWQLDALTLDNGRNRINANGNITEQWDLAASIDLPELQNLLPGLTGGFNANIDLKGELKNPDVLLQATSAAIRYNDIAINGLSLDADVKRGALTNSKLRLNVAQVVAAEQTISNTRLNLNGTRAAHNIALFADGPQKTSADLTASGALSEQFDWDGILKTAKLEVPAHVINLRKPTSISWDNQRKKFSIAPHCWGIQESNLCLKNQVLAEETGQAIVQLDAYGLEQLNPFLQAQANLLGTLNADLTVDWGAAFAGGYAIKLDAGVTGGAIKVQDTGATPLNFQYETLTLNARADADAVDAALTIDSDSMGQAAIDLSLDPASADKNITGTVDLSGFQIEFLKAFLPNFDALSGELSAKGELSGPLVDPLYSGNVLLSALIVQSEDLPLGIDGGSIKADIAGKRATIDGELSSGEGSIDVGGSANWLNSSYRADITLNTKQLNIVQEPLTSSTVNTRIKISATPDRIRIRGNVDVPAAEINIKELPRGAATLSDDVIVVEDIYAQTQQTKKKKAEAAKIDMKLNVSLGDDVNLSGYGMNASLTGKMSLSQVSPNPMQLGGEVTIVSGVYKQYGQDLKITDGQVLFVGPIDQTTLNIDAVREIDTEAVPRKAGLHLEGRLQDPEITLFTEPADKTQEAILSYIILGRDLGDASNQEQNLMASAAIALTIKGGRAITEDLAEKLGVQEISLDARGRGDTTELVVSGRVNDRLLLRYGRSVFDGSDTLYLRYDLTKQLYLEAAKGTARAVDLFYSFAF